MEDGWQVVYVFGSKPNDKLRKRLEEAGIRVEVWHGSAVQTP